MCLARNFFITFLEELSAVVIGVSSVSTVGVTSAFLTGALSNFFNCFLIAGASLAPAPSGSPVGAGTLPFGSDTQTPCSILPIA